MATSARLEELQEKFNENPRRYFAPLANEHRKLGDLDQAIALCRSHLPQQPQHVSGHIVLAQALFEAGEVADARGTFEMALDLDPENLIALRYLGDIARSEGDRSMARQWYSRVLDADPRNDDIALLIRELDVPPAQPEAPAFMPAQPNEQQEPAVALDAAPDLADVWQHEVDAQATPPATAAVEESQPWMDLVSPQDPAEAAPVNETLDADWQPAAAAKESISEEQPAEFELPRFDTSVETETPNEAWSPTPVATTPVQPLDAVTEDAATAFAEIDYSVFEAVADEEPIELAPPAAAAPESVAPEPEPQAEAEVAAPGLPEGAAPASTPVPAVAEPTVSPDDWFASAQADQDLTADGADATFDLDAAFQSVLPNQGSESAEFEAAEPSAEAPEWMPEPVTENAASEPVAEFESRELSSEVAVPDTGTSWEPDVGMANDETPPEVALTDEAEWDDMLAAEPDATPAADGQDSTLAEAEIAPSAELVEQAAAESDSEPAATWEDQPVTESEHAPMAEWEDAPAAEWAVEPGTAPDDASADAAWSLDAMEANTDAGALDPEAADVESAFAELDRLAGEIEDDLAAANAMLLPDEGYSASPNASDSTYSPTDATPESGVAAVEETGGAFVTETMAELYLQQGFRDEALAVYRQLVQRYPDDAVLAERVRALEGNDESRGTAEPSVPASPQADALGQSVRAFLGVFARRRAPMRRRAPAVETPAPAPSASSTPLGAMFGTPADADDQSAAVLAGAFAEPNGSSATLPGRPTRAADAELKLGDVFRSTPASGTAHSASFDEFFSTGSSEPASSPLDDQGSDMEQFTAWLEGLKKK